MKRGLQSFAPLSPSVSGKDETGKARLLIISDCSERVSRLCAALDNGEVEITGVSVPRKLNRHLRHKYDLAIIDIGLEQIAKTLKTLRSKAEYAGIHVLVECTRISTELGEPPFAGLLPRYRAMACGHLDLIALVKSWTTSTSNNQRARGLL